MNTLTKINNYRNFKKLLEIGQAVEKLAIEKLGCFMSLKL